MLFVDEPAMADLNKRFLRREGPTDVLAFPIDEEPVEGGRSPDSGGTGPGFTGEPDDLPTLLGQDGLGQLDPPNRVDRPVHLFVCGKHFDGHGIRCRSSRAVHGQPPATHSR